MQRCHKERDECLFSVKYSFAFCSVLQTDFSVQLLQKLLAKLAFSICEETLLHWKQEKTVQDSSRKI